MIVADKYDLLDLFTLVHGEMSEGCSAEVIYDDDFEPVAVACVKYGSEAWRASLGELTVDYAVMQMRRQAGGTS